MSKSGSIVTVIGPMFSGKTTEVIRLSKLKARMGKKCVIIRHSDDIRYGVENITNHDGDVFNGHIVVLGKKVQAADVVMCKTIADVDMNKYDVLVIDEVGYLPFSRDGASLLFQLINMRYEKKSTLITTNIPLSQWSEFLQDKKLTNALLDRLVHHSKVISITGKSYRMKDYSEKKTKTPKSK